MFSLLPPATRALILINVAVFLLQQLAPDLMAGLFALWPLGSPLFRPWQLLSYAFLHGNLVHIGSGAQEEVIGASGGVFGVLLAFAWYFPRQRIILLFPPIPMPAWLFVTVYGLLELFFGVTGRQQGVAHFAHLGGMLGGALCILYWRTRRRFS